MLLGKLNRDWEVIFPRLQVSGLEISIDLTGLIWELCRKSTPSNAEIAEGFKLLSFSLPPGLIRILTIGGLFNA